MVFGKFWVDFGWILCGNDPVGMLRNGGGFLRNWNGWKEAECGRHCGRLVRAAFFKRWGTDSWDDVTASDEADLFCNYPAKI